MNVRVRASEIFHLARFGAARAEGTNPGIAPKLAVFCGLSIFKYIHPLGEQRVTGQKTYSTEAAAAELGISKSTLLRWIKEKRIKDVRRDRNNWRVFSERDVQLIRANM